MQTKTQTNLDPAFRWLTLASGLAVLLLVGGILYTLVVGAMPSLKHFGFGFFASQAWDPAFMEFGALSSVYGTLLSTAIGMLIAVPLSLVIALFLVEIAPPSVSRLVGGAIELLAAIPSIIYGMWGLFVFAPFLADYVQPWLASGFKDMGGTKMTGQRDSVRQAI